MGIRLVCLFRTEEAILDRDRDECSWICIGILLRAQKSLRSIERLFIEPVGGLVWFIKLGDPI